MIFQKSSTDQQGVSHLNQEFKAHIDHLVSDWSGSYFKQGKNNFLKVLLNFCPKMPYMIMLMLQFNVRNKSETDTKRFESVPFFPSASAFIATIVAKILQKKNVPMTTIICLVTWNSVSRNFLVASVIAVSPIDFFKVLCVLLI